VRTRQASQRRQWRLELSAVAYNVVLVLLLPVLLLYLLWRLLVRGKSREGFRQRLGSMPPEVNALGESGDPVIWVHAVSVGEVAAVQPFLRQLRLLQPLARIVLSTTTPTGQRLARNKLEAEIDALIYFPFDFQFVVQRTLNAINPRLLVMVETELWPNILSAAKRGSVATALINGRISDRAYRKDLLARPILALALARLDVVCAQSEQDAERFKRLGAAPERVVVMGNTKFDEQFPLVAEAEAAKWRHDFGFPQDAAVLVAGSTHPGEEELVLDAFAQLRRDNPGLQLVIAPRHPERGDEVERLVNEHGYASYRRSRVLTEIESGKQVTVTPGPEVRVIILDTIGELARVFAIATVVFMGGSLVAKGGHNLLQPLAQGCPVIFGPYMNNFRDITEIVLREGAGQQVQNLEELVTQAGELLASAEQRQALRERGSALIAKYSGASERMAERVSALLD